MANPELIRTIERCSMNGLPALRTIELEGWVLRFSDGYTNRANTVNPLGDAGVGDWNIDERVSTCEKLYREAGFDTIFKLTHAAVPLDLQTMLEERGYLPHGPLVNIQTCHVHKEKEDDRDEGRGSSAKRGITLVAESLKDVPWLMAFARMNSLAPATVNILGRMLQRIDKSSIFLRVVSNVSRKNVGCGYAVVEDGYLGLYDITVDERHRRQGIGELVMFGLMAWGREQGARTAYLQVVDDNDPALGLYGKFGFETAYQYWYLKKERWE